MDGNTGLNYFYLFRRCLHFRVYSNVEYLGGPHRKEIPHIAINAFLGICFHHINSSYLEPLLVTLTTGILGLSRTRNNFETILLIQSTSD